MVPGPETCQAGEGHKDDILKYVGNKGKVEITPLKGLGEMMPKVLWETTLNLMGKDPSARFRFIMERAEEAEALDV